jgi:hypothetical protein
MYNAAEGGQRRGSTEKRKRDETRRLKHESGTCFAALAFAAADIFSPKAGGGSSSSFSRPSL